MDFTFPADLRLTGTAITSANALPHYEGGSLRAVYDAGDENQLIIIDETDPDEYAAYCCPTQSTPAAIPLSCNNPTGSCPIGQLPLHLGAIFTNFTQFQSDS